MDYLKKLAHIEAEAILLVIGGRSEVEAYMATHPKASRATAAANAYKFFKKARGKLSDKDKLDLYNIGSDRIFSMLDKLLNAENDIIYQGKVTGKTPDNFTRYRATELLVRINGLLDQPEIKAEGNEPLRIIFDYDLPGGDFASDPNIEISEQH